MASSSYLCGICSFKNIAKECVIWCNDCNEGLCIDCQEHHGISKGTKQHNTINICQYQTPDKRTLEISEFCSKHNERYQIFCTRHDIPCCRKCVVESHNKCKNLSNIDDVTQGVKSSSNFLGMESNLNDVIKNIERICKDRQENIQTIKGERNKIVKNIKEIRQMINNHLDELEEKLLNDLKLTEEIEKKKIERFIETVEEKWQRMCQNQANIEHMKQHASDLQTFLSMKQIQSDISSINEFIDTVVKSDEMYNTVVNCDIDPMLLDFASKVAKFGEIGVMRNLKELILAGHKAIKVDMRIEQVSSRSMDHLTLQLEQTLKTVPTDITGCTMLPDGRMMFSMYPSERQILVMNKDSSVDFKMKTKFKTFDIAKLNEDNIIAVTSGDQNKISLIDITTRKELNSFTVGKYNYGIVVRDNTLLFCVESKGIQQLNMADASVRNIVTCQLSYGSSIATFKDNIYYTDPNTNTVTCCDLRGTRKWEVKDENALVYPVGISVDNAGIVYVAGYYSHNLVVISADGQYHREILSKDDGLLHPLALCCDRAKNKLLVANQSNSAAFLFKIT